jgi:amidase
MNLIDLSAEELSRSIRTRRVSCREVMQATLARIDALNPLHNAIVNRVEPESLLRQADACDATLAASPQAVGWLHGMPQAIKDIAATAGIPTTLGSPLLRNAVPREDSLMVQRMKAAGCIVIGKTNTPEFGLGSHTFNTVFGTTLNAYDPSKSAGGSSGGAAVALALRMVAVADGSDTMGSLRNPAAWNNIFALRPSQGRVPMWPAADVWMAPLGTEGPMGRTVLDVARLLDVQAGFDARVPLSVTDRPPSFADALQGADARATRIGWLGNLQGYLGMEAGILDACERGLRRLESLGCAVEPIAPGFSPERVWQAWLTWRHCVVAARIAPHLVRPENRALIKPEALWEFDQAQGITGMQLMGASAQRSAFYHRVLQLFEQCDVLALPAAQVWPFDATLRWPAQIVGREMDTYHRWMEVTLYATFAGLPVMCVPVGFDSRGLPMGMQLIGPPHADLAVLRLAAAYEAAAQDVLDVRPPTTAE